MKAPVLFLCQAPHTRFNDEPTGVSAFPRPFGERDRVRGIECKT